MGACERLLILLGCNFCCLRTCEQQLFPLKYFSCWSTATSVQKQRCSHELALRGLTARVPASSDLIMIFNGHILHLYYPSLLQENNLSNVAHISEFLPLTIVLFDSSFRVVGMSTTYAEVAWHQFRKENVDLHVWCFVELLDLVVADAPWRVE